MPRRGEYGAASPRGRRSQYDTTRVRDKTILLVHIYMCECGLGQNWYGLRVLLLCVCEAFDKQVLASGVLYIRYWCNVPSLLVPRLAIHRVGNIDRTRQ